MRHKKPQEPKNRILVLDWKRSLIWRYYVARARVTTATINTLLVLKWLFELNCFTFAFALCVVYANYLLFCFPYYMPGTRELYNGEYLIYSSLVFALGLSMLWGAVLHFGNLRLIRTRISEQNAATA